MHQRLHQQCLEAIEDGDFSKVHQILRTRCNNPNKQNRVTRFQPTSTHLSEALYHNHLFLVKTFLGFPYFVRPDDACLAYAIKNNNKDLSQLFLKRYRVEPTEGSLAYAVSACNIPMIKYLIHKRGVPVNEDLYDEIYEEPEEMDDFTPSERLARNNKIRHILRKALL